MRAGEMDRRGRRRGNSPGDAELGGDGGTARWRAWGQGVGETEDREVVE